MTDYERVCPVCGLHFVSHKWNGVYCSDRCRKRASRMRGMMPMIPDRPITMEHVDDVDDVLGAVSAARAASNRLAQLARTCPYPLRPGCKRISIAITEAIGREGW